MRTVRVLVVPLLVLVAIAGCGGGSKRAAHHRHRQVVSETTPSRTLSESPTESSSPTPAATVIVVTASRTALPSPASTTRAQVANVTGFKQFISPTKNVGCEMDASSARCDIKQHSWTPPPKPADCPVDWGQGIQVLKKGKAGFVCAGDTAFDPKADVLAYGHAFQIGDMLCISATSGMSCQHLDTGHGFTISRETYRLE